MYSAKLINVLFELWGAHVRCVTRVDYKTHVLIVLDVKSKHPIN